MMHKSTVGYGFDPDSTSSVHHTHWLDSNSCFVIGKGRGGKREREDLEGLDPPNGTD